MRLTSLILVLSLSIGLVAAVPVVSADPPMDPQGCEPMIAGLCVHPVTPILCSIEGNPLCE
jgi:hypothetical protein